MRSKNDAPVDTMGCDKGLDTNGPPEVSITKISLILAVFLNILN